LPSFRRKPFAARGIERFALMLRDHHAGRGGKLLESGFFGTSASS
jgi:hypothetical protein